MKVLIVSQYFWPEEFRVNELASSLLERGHSVDVLTGLPNYPQGRFFPGYSWFNSTDEALPHNLNNIKIQRVPLISRGRKKGVRLLINYLSFVFFASLYILLFYRKKKYDCTVVFAVSPLLQAIPALFLRWLNGTKSFVWVQDLWPETLSAVGVVKSAKALGLVGNLVRWIYRRSDLVLVQSEAFIDSVVSWGAERRKIRYFPNWSDEVGVVESDSNEVMPAGFNVVFAGNLGRAQGLETILAAAEKTRAMTDLNWVILGDGSERIPMQELAEKMGLERTVRFLGRKPASTMPYYFGNAGALLVTLRDEKIFSLTVPSKIQAYLAAGRPILAAIDGEGARIIELAKAGFAAPALDAESLANNALRLYSMSITDRAEMGQNGRKFYESHFQRDRLISNLESWMREFSR